ncbi:hypothetical protein OUZ56_007497 [Daphnia magna]|uniref:Uncharacterized protein n=1 Tax=Daphnia magna TaxID=35525 RepID=A0ABR0AA44_9CRUS|nr:hypothetical protein OUZ56_007497 [Daphnia magna]
MLIIPDTTEFIKIVLKIPERPVSIRQNVRRLAGAASLTGLELVTGRSHRLLLSLSPSSIHLFSLASTRPRPQQETFLTLHVCRRQVQRSNQMNVRKKEEELKG